MSTWLVLAAAGRGDRLRADRPKAFVRFGGRVLLAESLERLDGSAWIDSIVVVAPPGWEEPTILLAEELGCAKVAACVAGGQTRDASVRAGIDEVPQDAAAIVVHDAARPLVAEEVVERLLTRLADGWDGVVPAIEVNDTIKRAHGQRVVETLAREELVAAQTPQAFVAPMLREAFGRRSSAPVTDCASVVERVGGRVSVVQGDVRLHKITTEADLRLVESWL